MAGRLEEQLGINLRARRIAARLTQQELAARANISVGALKHLEQGTGSSLRTLTRVLEVLGAEHWIDQLAPAKEPFNPLALLGSATRAPKPKGPPRVRRSVHR